MHEKGVSRVSVGKGLAHSTETFLTGTLLCLVSGNLRWRTFLCQGMGTRGEHHDYVSFFCYLKLPEIILEEPFCVSEGFSYRNFFCIMGIVNDFLSELFCLTVTKDFVGEPFCASETFWS